MSARGFIVRGYALTPLAHEEFEQKRLAARRETAMRNLFGPWPTVAEALGLDMSQRDQSLAEAWRRSAIREARRHVRYA